MDRLALLETLIAAVEDGSLNRAAQTRSISQPAVSQQIRQLETELSQPLLIRGATGVSPTRAGEAAYRYAKCITGTYGQMRRELATLDNEISGTFRINTSSFLGRRVMGPMLMELAEEYPALNIVMKMEDRLVDIQRETVDLAIRLGRLGDTDGIGRKIGALETLLFASPAYLQKMGQPSHPNDLRKLKFVQHHEEQTSGIFELYPSASNNASRSTSPVKVPVPIAFTVDDPDLILQAVDEGAGFSRAPRVLIDRDLASGRFVPVLPGYNPPPKDLFAVYPSRYSFDRRHKLIIERLLERLAEQVPLDLHEGHSATAMTA